MALTLGMPSVVLRQERLVELDILVAWFTSFYFCSFFYRSLSEAPMHIQTNKTGMNIRC
ncbi:MAG: hypothetical protein ABFS56_32205 [Pseudomonadota bacterium]